MHVVYMYVCNTLNRSTVLILIIYIHILYIYIYYINISLLYILRYTMLYQNDSYHTYIYIQRTYIFEYRCTHYHIFTTVGLGFRGWGGVPVIYVREFSMYYNL